MVRFDIATTTNAQIVPIPYREGAARELMDEKEFEEETRWQKLSLWDKLGDWSYRHQYSLIMGSWATSLAVAGAIISRNEFVTQIPPNFFLTLAFVQVSDLSSKDRTGSNVGSRIDDRSPHRRRCTNSFEEDLGKRGGMLLNFVAVICKISIQFE